MSFLYTLYSVPVEDAIAMRRKTSRQPSRTIDKPLGQRHTKTSMLQVSSNNSQAPDLGSTLAGTLVDLGRGDAAVLDRIDLPGDEARRLMELGFLPGARITAGLSAPGGDPRVFQVDGAEIALRRETASQLKVRISPKTRNG
jgi:ferrous iron transport protein A